MSAESQWKRRSVNRAAAIARSLERLSVEALPDEDLVFFTVKDLSHGMVGTPAGERASK